MIIKDNNFRVMKLFFDSPDKSFYVRQISRLTRLSPPGILKIAGKLKREGLLVSKKEKVVEEISASRSEKFIHLKLCYNILALFDSNLINFLRDVYEEPEAIVVFGSFARGEDISTSDIDIAVVTGKRANVSLKNFEKHISRKINVYEIKLAECQPQFLNNLANGYVLYGRLEVVR